MRGGGCGRARGRVGLTATLMGGWNTGSNQYGPGRAAARDTSATPGGSASGTSIRGVADLQSLRRAVGDDPVARKQVDDLIHSMQQLDPRRFPGNPEVVSQLFAEVHTGVDRLELQLGHDPADENRDGRA